MGSNQSAMNGYVELARVSREPAEGSWVELNVPTERAYRYVKYAGPPGSHGAIAELELYAGDARVRGEAFATEPRGGQEGSSAARALDGDPETFFQGSLPDQSYVGLDLAGGHVAPAPELSPPPGALAPGQRIELRAPEGASAFFTLDGSDPRLEPRTPYRGPIDLPAATALLRAVTTQPCSVPSEVVQGAYRRASAGQVASPRLGASSMHVGNSLTDVLVDHFVEAAAHGGVSLDFHRYTIPGAGLWLYVDAPTGGFGVDDVRATLRSTPFDHLVMQPFPNMPCQPAASADGDDSDAGYASQAWTDALRASPSVRLWIYQQWPDPRDFRNCITGGEWTRGDWSPADPNSWEKAVENELDYQEAVAAELARLHPERERARVVPAGLALVALKRAVEAGELPGVGDFFPAVFSAGGTDIHPTPLGAYFVSEVFYARLFGRDPRGKPVEASLGLAADTAASLQAIAWRSVSAYAASHD